MSGFLFLLAINLVMGWSSDDKKTGIRWDFTKLLEDLDFAGDIALLSSVINFSNRKQQGLKEMQLA